MSNSDKQILFNRVADYRNDFIRGNENSEGGLLALMGLVRELGLEKDYLAYVKSYKPITIIGVDVDCIPFQ